MTKQAATPLHRSKKTNPQLCSDTSATSNSVGHATSPTSADRSTASKPSSFGCQQQSPRRKTRNTSALDRHRTAAVEHTHFGPGPFASLGFESTHHGTADGVGRTRQRVFRYLVRCCRVAAARGCFGGKRGWRGKSLCDRGQGEEATTTQIPKVVRGSLRSIIPPIL